MEGGQLLLYCLVLQLSQGFVHVRASELSFKKSLVYGPGIDSKRCSLPVNYFYIQAVDKDGNNSMDIDKSNLTVTFESTERVRYRSDTFDLGGGLIMYQFRVFSDLQSLTMHVKYKGRPLGRSPFQLSPVLHEDCASQLRTSSQWLKDFKCRSEEPQIVRDLKPFKDRGGVNVSDLYDRATKMFSRQSLVHYSIVNGKLYARTFGDIVGFKMLSDMILLSVVNKVVLPNLELIVNLGDWPLSTVTKRDSSKAEPFPMFSWCGSGDSWDIVWPTWDLMKSAIMGLDRVSLSILTALRTLGHPPWEERQPKAYFRGRDSNQARLDLVRDHHRNKELFDVGITEWFFFNHDEKVHGPKAKRVGFHDFFNYKYQLNIDGTVAAYRLPYLLAGGSLVIKQDSPYYEHFYHQLEPWVHYVPMKRDVSDVRDRVEWARDNDEQAREIAGNAARFVQQNLLPEHLYCYMVRLLTEYSELMVGTPKIHPGMGAVEPEVPHDCTSVCEAILSTVNTTSKQRPPGSNQPSREEL